MKLRLKLIISGYIEKGRSLAVLLLFTVGALAAGGLIVYPLWKFAVTFPETYTISVLITMGFLILFYSVIRVRKGRRNSIISRSRPVRFMRRERWIKAGKLIVTLVSLYILVIQFTAGAWIRGTVILLLLFFILGWMWFGKPHDRRYSSF